jgi:hypothetical protein
VDLTKPGKGRFSDFSARLNNGIPPPPGFFVCEHVTHCQLSVLRVAQMADGQGDAARASRGLIGRGRTWLPPTATRSLMVAGGELAPSSCRPRWLLKLPLNSHWFDI